MGKKYSGKGYKVVLEHYIVLVHKATCITWFVVSLNSLDCSRHGLEAVEKICAHT